METHGKAKGGIHTPDCQPGFVRNSRAPIAPNPETQTSLEGPLTRAVALPESAMAPRHTSFDDAHTSCFSRFTGAADSVAFRFRPGVLG